MTQSSPAPEREYCDPVQRMLVVPKGFSHHTTDNGFLQIVTPQGQLVEFHPDGSQVAIYASRKQFETGENPVAAIQQSDSVPGNVEGVVWPRDSDTDAMVFGRGVAR